jgi:hypothetical protein
MADLYENNDSNYDFVINLRSEHPSTAEQNIQFPEQWTKALFHVWKRSKPLTKAR